jgi:glycosyltransferase involved in cell wall biosynthesis
MKVLHVETGMNLYGGALQVFYLLRGLQEKGIENVLVCPRGSEIAQAATPFADVHPLTMRGELDFIFGHRLSQTILRKRPDLLHVHSRRGADLWGALAAIRTGCKSIVTRRVDNPEKPWLVRLKYRQFDHVIAISDGIRNVLLHEGVPADHVTCVHSAVDVDVWQKPCNRPWFNQQFGLPENARAIGVIAQLIARKGHRFLIEAMPAVLDKHPEAYFIFFGKGTLQQELEELCRDIGVEKHVVFAGFRNDLDRILPCLDLVVHPALMEGLGVSLLQAAAARVPIVAARAGGIPEIVINAVSGLLVEPGNSRELEEKISRILADEKLADALAQGGRAVVEEKYSLARMVEGNLNMYRYVLDHQK